MLDTHARSAQLVQDRAELVHDVRDAREDGDAEQVGGGDEASMPHQRHHLERIGGNSLLKRGLCTGLQLPHLVEQLLSGHCVGGERAESG